MGTIGSIVVNLEANSAQFEKTTGKVNHELDGVKHHAEGMNLKAAFTEGLGIGAAIEGIHMAGEAVEKLVEIGKEAVEMVADTVKEVTRTFRLAGTLNMPTDALMAYQNAAKASGIEVDVFTNALEHMQRSIGKGAEDGGRAAKAIEQLGLSAKELANEGADKSFEQIAEKIAGIENPTERATAAADIFGAKMGQKLLPLLMQGAAGLEKFKEEGKEFGNTFNDFEAAKLVAVNEEFMRMGERLEGVKDRIVMALAPTILALGKELESVIPSADKMKDYLMEALHAVGMGIGYVMDVWQILKAGIQVGAAAAAAEITGILSAVAMLGEGVEKLLNMLPGVHVQFSASLYSIRDTAWEMTKSLADQSAQTWNQPWPHTQVDQFFQHMNTEADKAGQEIAAKHSNIAAPLSDSFEQAGEKIEKTLAEMQKEIDTFGMSAAQKKLFELKADGANDQQMQRGEAMVKQLEALEAQKKATDEAAAAQKKLTDEGKRIHEEMETPLEKYNERMEHLNQLLADGKISQDDFARASMKANEELEKQNKHKEKESDHAATTMIRRFDFRMPAQMWNQEKKKDPTAIAEKTHEVTVMVLQGIQCSVGELKKQSAMQADMQRYQREEHDGTGSASDTASVLN